MPQQYEAIRDSYLEQGKSLKDSKTIAAKIYISRGKGRKARSSRAKSLHKD
jgi:hypothetical protein